MSKTLKFIDLFSGLGGFHLALKKLGHQCVFSSEINVKLADLYEQNFNLRPNGDIRLIDTKNIPSHDVLCAGFPCQPFSKAGEQLGTKCTISGDLFSEHILRIIRYHRPRFFIMENVANLEKHNGGNTWLAMRAQLEELGYSIDAKVLSPHRFRVPQIRKRLFIVGDRLGLENFSWPNESRDHEPDIRSILDKKPKNIRPLTVQVKDCLGVWQEFLSLCPKNTEIPSFPIWTMEFGATYPYREYNSLYDAPLKILKNSKGSFGHNLSQYHYRKDILTQVPSYAQGRENIFPLWKQNFIGKNREYYLKNKKWIKPWLSKVRKFPSSFQKFEWNCKGEKREIKNYLIQFRASGVRLKRPTTAPSLVAMTSTQVPIISWEDRYMTPYECSRLQSMEGLKYLPKTLTDSYKALGNAVNAKLVLKISKNLLKI